MRTFSRNLRNIFFHFLRRHPKAVIRELQRLLLGIREVIEKYCSFMPVPIFLSKANAEAEYETIDEAELKEDDVVIEHIQAAVITVHAGVFGLFHNMNIVGRKSQTYAVSYRRESRSYSSPMIRRKPYQCPIRLW